MVDGVRETTAEAPAPDGAAADSEQRVAEFMRLVAAGHDEMARVGFVVTGLAGPAQDAVQAAWAKVWRGLATLASAEAPRAWLLGLTAKEARRLTEAASGPDADALGGPGAPTTRASSEAAYRADELALANTLAELDVHDRMIIALRYVGSLDSDEIGRELGMPGSAVLARVARILGRLLNDPRYGEAPTETVAELEGALARRLWSLTDRAITPIDAEVVAQVAIQTVPAPTVGEQLQGLVDALLDWARSLDRRVWMAGAGIIVAVAAFSFLRGGSAGAVPIVTPVPTDATRLCTPGELTARVTGWAADGIQRTASVEMRNVAPGACLVDPLPEVWLVDRGGIQLMVGKDRQVGRIRIGPGETLRTGVTVMNYCGAPPKAPVTLAFRQGTDVIQAQPLNGEDTSGVPPCAVGGTGTVQMQPWAP